jgi:hypothetical protein
MAKKTTTKGYTIDFTGETIYITKGFAKAASIVGTEEYNVMVKLRRDCVDYEIKYKTINRKVNKNSYKGLTIEVMKKFIESKGESNVENFKNIRIIRDNNYAAIKKWFIEKYADEYKKMGNRK